MRRVGKGHLAVNTARAILQERWLVAMEERVNEDEWEARYGDRLRRIEQTVFFGNGDPWVTY